MNVGLERYRYYFYALKSSPLFDQLPDEALNYFLEHCTWQLYPKKTIIQSTSKPADKFFVILRGKIKAYHYNPYRDRNFTFFLLRKHDVFDVLQLIDKITLDIDYKALKQAEILEIGFTHFRIWLKEYPEFEKNLLIYQLQKMKLLEENMLDMAIQDTDYRLAKLLYNNFQEGTNGANILDDMSHSELASMIGTTRPVLNRRIRSLIKKGIVGYRNKKLIITNSLLLKKLIRTEKL